MRVVDSKKAQILKYIHAADLHLGGRDVWNLPQSREHFFAAYERLLSHCLEKQVHCLLIAGDFFEQASIRAEEVEVVLEGLRRLEKASIQVFLVSGNHDPTYYSSLMESIAWPNNVFRFSETSTYYNKELSYAVSGVDFPSARQEDSLWPKLITAQEEAYKKYKWPSHCFQIALMHGQLVDGKKKSKYNPLSLEDLRTSSFDYLALGHEHLSTPRWETFEDKTYAYPGATQASSFRDLGENGAWYFEVDTRTKEIVQKEFLSCSSKLYEIVEIFLHSTDVAEERIEAALANFVNAIEESKIAYALRVRIQGEVLEPLTEERLERIRREYEKIFQPFVLDNQTTLLLQGKWEEKDSPFFSDIMERLESAAKQYKRSDRVVAEAKAIFRKAFAEQEEA